jgi:phosphatidylglycerol:prolipoprotein diacylglycerol transferase
MYPVLFKIGNFPVHTFGVVLIVAFLVGLMIARKRAPRFGVDPNRISDLAFWMLIAGVLGARALFLIQEPPKDWHEIFSLQFAGLTSFGGIIGAAFVVAFWCRKHKVATRAILDIFGPPLLIGWAIGRVGCLMNGCCYGIVCPADFPLGVHTPENAFVHYPAQMLDSLLNVLAFGAVLLIEKRRQMQLGQVFALALSLQGLSRFIYEFARAGTPEQLQRGLASSTYWDGLPITEAHAAAAVMIVTGIVLGLVYAKRPVVREPQPA